MLKAAFRPEPEETEAFVAAALAERLSVRPILERGGYQPDRRHRMFGLVGTTAMYALVVVGFCFTVTRSAPVKAPSTLTVFDVQASASPPEIRPEKKLAPQPVRKKEPEPEPPTVQPVERTIVPVATMAAPMPVATPRSADPGPVEPETAAPKTMQAPPAPRVASNTPDSWEGRLLAQLNKHRRYPNMAQRHRQQGVPYIRFVMDREGRVLSSRIERSSGFPELDREAVGLPKRAQPLPRPPAEKAGDTLELVVPVEFFLHR